MPWNDEAINKLYVAIGSNIRDARLEAEITQSELGRRLDLTRSSIANIEGGRQRMLIHSLLQVANELKVPILRLLRHEVDISESRVVAELEGQPESTHDFVTNALSKLDTKQRREG